MGWSTNVVNSLLSLNFGGILTFMFRGAAQQMSASTSPCLIINTENKTFKTTFFSIHNTVWKISCALQFPLLTISCGYRVCDNFVSTIAPTMHATIKMLKTHDCWATKIIVEHPCGLIASRKQNKNYSQHLRDEELKLFVIPWAIIFRKPHIYHIYFLLTLVKAIS